jgi:hypothetical protein
MKYLSIHGDAAIDWPSLRIVPSRPEIVVISVVRAADHVTCRVRCSPGEDIEYVEGYLMASARRRRTDKHSDEFDTKLAVPVRCARTVDLVVTPATATISFLGSPPRGMIRLLLRGERLKESERPIVGIDCEGYAVEWELSKPSQAGAAVLAVSLAATDCPEGARGDTLHIDVGSSRILRVPFVTIERSVTSQAEAEQPQSRKGGPS